MHENSSESTFLFCFYHKKRKEYCECLGVFVVLLVCLQFILEILYFSEVKMRQIKLNKTYRTVLYMLFYFLSALLTHLLVVYSLPGHIGPPEALPKPDVTQDSPSADLSTDRDPKHRTVMERRREGRYKTFDWAEFRLQKKKPNLDADLQKTKALCSLELADLERRKRREERRRRYESMLGISLGWEGIGDDTEDDGIRSLSPKSQLKVEENIEECWKLVEKTIFRLERTVPMFNEEKESVEMEKLLDSYRKGVSASSPVHMHTDIHIFLMDIRY